ncbi:high frequency lysogenization protein [Mariprofundus micogutta]|uniref:High frequency lysogenization protein n=2 Tax=Mariprofundus micogutta TaxID=1921010 RepID=A0A1L8CL99_9PROT|nr:high frequency lysogenization protein [Mariprofundus micogutta]
MTQRTTALAALIQAVYLVDSIARKGIADPEDSRVLIESIFSQGTHDPAMLYGGLNKLQTGLRVSSQILGGNDFPQSKALMTYCAGLLSIEKRLSKHAEMRNHLADGITRIEKQKQYFGDAMHNNIIAAMADLYGETISTMNPRIIVRGKTEHLSQADNTRRVRSLLMAGLRAAHIWHAHGGGHLTLLLRRKAIQRELGKLLKTASE